MVFNVHFRLRLKGFFLYYARTVLSFDKVKSCIHLWTGVHFADSETTQKGYPLLQYQYSQARFSRRRRRFGLRHAALPMLAIIFVYALISFFGTPDEDIATAELSVTAESVVAAMAPNSTAHNGTVDATSGVTNMKSAFMSAPAPRSNTYGAIAEKADKPAVQKTQHMETTAAERIAFIQSGIQKVLDAGSELFVAEKKVTVGKGDTLMELLISNDVPRSEAYNAIQALSKVYNPRDLNPGHSITVFFHKDPIIADPKFSGLQIEKDKIHTVMVNRAEDGSFTADSEEKPIYRSLKGYAGTIDNSLYLSAKASGVPDGVIIDLIKMYSWNVDFQRDIQSGDKFEIMFEEYATDEGDIVSGKGNIVFARLTLGDRDMPFYLYEMASGDTDYFDDKGMSAKKALMKTPIDGARLSSGFGMRRHPVLGYGKMHKGVDFAAASGTPIYAAGDGTIEKIGPFSSYGKYIRIRHRRDLQTAYAHMKGFRSGLKAGSRVKQGQIIGYVGTTGRSTGPHLHYEVLLNGKQVNPKSLKLPTGKSLESKDMAKFKSLVKTRDGEFAQLLKGVTIADSQPAASTKQAALKR